MKNQYSRGFQAVCPIITQASILLIIPVAFIYTFLLKLQIMLLLKGIYTARIYFLKHLCYDYSDIMIYQKFIKECSMGKFKNNLATNVNEK